MAFVNTDIELGGTTMAQSTGMPGTADDQNMQLNSHNVERDDLAIIREKRLLLMSRCSFLTVFVSLCAIVVGVLALLFSDSFPYKLGGGIVAGGMSLLMTICPFCMYLEGKKTKTGTKMTGLFKCNLICLMVWFSFTICGILFALGIPGLWGMLECVIEQQRRIRQTSLNFCADQTSEKLTLSVLTFVLSAILLILAIVIICIFCCNTKAFGYKTIYQRRYEFYRDMIRTEMQQEAEEQRANERSDQARGMDGYRGNMPQENERYNPREPSAPPLEHSDMYRDNRGQQNRGPPRRFRDHPRDYNEDGYHPRDSPRHSRRPDYERNRPHASKEKLKNDNEAPPPSYDDVVDKYLKADDV